MTTTTSEAARLAPETLVQAAPVAPPKREREDEEREEDDRWSDLPCTD